MMHADRIARGCIYAAAICIAALAAPPVLQALAWVIAVWLAALGAL